LRPLCNWQRWITAVSLWQRLLGGQRLSMGDYVSLTRPTNAPTAAGGG